MNQYANKIVKYQSPVDYQRVTQNKNTFSNLIKCPWIVTDYFPRLVTLS